jgi:glycosyltransferase involved in cell wall biosynthesis
MKKLLFSVIIPTLNEEARIWKLLQSLERQSFKNFEIVVVDGGSSDRTIEVAEEFSAKVFVRKGCKEFPSRNIGAKFSNGNLLLFLSADVILSLDALKNLAKELEKDQNVCGICGLGMPYEAPLWMKIEYLFHWRLLRLWMKLTKDYHASTNFMAVRKDDFHRVGEFTDEIFADTIFFNKLGKKCKIKVLPKLLVFVSGRRAKNMGFARFTTHFLWVFLFDYLPFLRKNSLVKFLQRYSSDFRARHG